MDNLNNFVWRTKDGATLKMIDMDVKHLQYAYAYACLKEFDYHIRSGNFSDLRDQMEAVAEARGIVLLYPDDKHPSGKCKQYFCNLRKTKAITPRAVTAKVVNYIGLEKVNAELNV